MRYRTPSLAIMTVVALSGCANPMLAIDAPGYSVSRSTAPTGEPQSMTQAVQKLNHVRATYYTAIVDQSGVAQNSTIGLVWLGTAIAGMAAGHVHRDAIVGASLLGGTAYAVARTQLDARRIQIWIEGIKALDCAREASLPLDIGDARRTGLEQAAGELATQRDKVRLARDEVVRRARVPALARTPAETATARTLAAKADTAVSEAERTVEAAQELLRASRGDELSLAVNRISTKVVEAMSTIAIDPSAVRQMIAGIGGFAAVFAPGAGLEDTIPRALQNYNAATEKAKKEVKPEGSSPEKLALDAAAVTLASELQALEPLQRRVTSMLSRVDLAAVTAALKKCDVANVLQPISFAPASLEFDGKATATKGFAISGGTLPYEVTALDELPEGSAISFKGGALGDSAQVKIPASAAPGEYRLRVADSSSPNRQSQQMIVRVGSGGGGATGAGQDAGADKTPGQADVEKAWQDFGAKLNGYALADLQGVNLKVTSAKKSGAKLAVSLTCSPVKPVPAQIVRDALSAADKPDVQILRSAKALDANSSQIDFGASKCIK